MSLWPSASSSGSTRSFVTKYTDEPSVEPPRKPAAESLALPSFAPDRGTVNQLSAACAGAAMPVTAATTIAVSSRPLTRSPPAADEQLQVGRVGPGHGPGCLDRDSGEGGVRVLGAAVGASLHARAADRVAGVRELLRVVADGVEVARVRHAVGV